MRTILIALLMLCSSLVATATTLVPTDVAEMSREARAIAIGRVAAIEARWTGDRRRIETLVTLEAEGYFKGALGSNLQFVVAGGELGRYRNIVVGAPQFVLGQEIVVFLGGREPGLPYIIGFNQGLFRVVSSNGIRVVRPASPALRLNGESIELNAFARQVRALAGDGR